MILYGIDNIRDLFGHKVRTNTCPADAQNTAMLLQFLRLQTIVQGCFMCSGTHAFILCR